MDEVLSLRGSLRRGPWNGGDLNDVFAQRSEIQTVPGGVAQDLGEPPEYTRYIRSGVRNGDFAALPPSPTGVISDITNKLPDWSFVAVQGTSITAAAVADASSATGYVIRWSCASGTLNDEAYIEQVVPILANRKGAFAVWVNAYFLAASLATATFQTRVSATYLKSDGTTTGSTSTDAANFTTSVSEPTVTPGTSGTSPGDAVDLRIRIGVKRTATNATTGTIDLCDVFQNMGSDAVLIPDDTTTTNAPAWISKRDGVLSIQAGVTATPGVVLSAGLNAVRSTGIPYGVRANRTATQSIANAADTSINFTATDSYDVNSMHDTVTNNARIVLQRDGYWMVGGGVQFAASGAGDRALYIEVNGVDGAGTRLKPWSRTPTAAGLETALNLSFPRYFSAGDYIALTVRQNSGGALNVEDAVFWAQLIAADA